MVSATLTNKVPVLTVTSAASAIDAPAPCSTTSPPASVTPCAKLPAPVSVVVPPVARSELAAPVMSRMVPPLVLMLPVSAPLASVPPARLIAAIDWSKPPRSSVPPVPIVTRPLPCQMFAAPDSKVPPVIVVVPVCASVPVTVNAPLPCLARLPVLKMTPPKLVDASLPPSVSVWPASICTVPPVPASEPMVSDTATIRLPVPSVTAAASLTLLPPCRNRLPALTFTPPAKFPLPNSARLPPVTVSAPAVLALARPIRPAPPVVSA